MAAIITCGECGKFLDAYKSAEKLMRIENKIYGKSDDIVVAAFINSDSVKTQEQIIKACSKVYVVDNLGSDLELITILSAQGTPIVFAHDIKGIYTYKKVGYEVMSYEEYVSRLKDINKAVFSCYRTFDMAINNANDNSSSGRYMKCTMMFDEEPSDTKGVRYKDMLGIRFEVCVSRKIWI